MALTEHDRDVLDFAAHHWRNQGAKITALRERLGLTETSYYRQLVRLMDHPEACARIPALMRTLRNARETRRRLHSDPFAYM